MAMSEEAKAELAAAVKILKDDGVHVHKMLGKFGNADPAKDSLKKEEPKEGEPPPVKDKEDTPEPKKRHAWWGEASDD